MNKIAIYAIAKNELQFLEKWYKSMSEADYIVVLDTGSTDGLWEALQDLSKKDPKVIVSQKTYSPWRFDTPRNDAMDLVPADCNILMSTDLDEWLEPGWAKPLREEWIEGKHQRCTYKYVWSHLEDGSPGRIFNYNKIHTRNWIWKYPVHELLWDTITKSEHYTRDVNLNLFDKITLHHYPDKTKSRASYLPLLEQRKAENPEDWYGRIYLSHEYVYRGLYQKAIDELNEILRDYRDHYSSVEEASCYLFRGDSLVKLNRKEEAMASYLQAIKIEPTYREPYIALARVLEDEKLWEQARAVLQDALQKTYRHYTWLERDRSWSYELYDILSIACFYSGHKLESIAYATIALDKKKNDKRLQKNLELCLSLSKDSELH